MATPTVDAPSLPASPGPTFSATGSLAPITPRNTILNLPEADEFDNDSAPGTPMSCISTVAIKDGHEGHRPGMSGFDGAAERISRLSALTAGGYFDVDKRPDTPSSVGCGPGSVDVPADCDTPKALTAALEEARRKKQLQAASADSPASSVTTESAREQRREARLIDGMTYDDDVVDTTDRSPLVAGTPKEEDK